MYSGSKSQGWVGFRDKHFGDVPLGFLGILKVKLGSADVGVGLGSAFRGRVGFGDQTFGEVSLSFQGFGAGPEYITMSKQDRDLLRSTPQMEERLFLVLHCFEVDFLGKF